MFGVSNGFGVEFGGAFQLVTIVSHLQLIFHISLGYFTNVPHITGLF